MPTSKLQSAARKHVTSACLFCRRKKVRCDGNTPVCANCETAKQQCTYNRESDGRKSGSRRSVSALAARLEALEERRQSRELDTVRAKCSLSTLSQDTDNEIKGDESYGQEQLYAEDISNSGSESANPITPGLGHSPDSRTFRYPANPQQSQLDVQFEPFSIHVEGSNTAHNAVTRHGQYDAIANSASPEPWVIDVGVTSTENYHRPPGTQIHYDIAEDSGNQTNQLCPSIGQSEPRLLNIGRSHPGPTSNKLESSHTNELMDRLADRMGSFQIAEDGQLRYFGATSNLHILHNGMLSLSRSRTQSIRQDGAAALQRAGLAQHVVSPGIEFYLERLYFTWEDPAIHVVDEEMYFSQKARWQADHEDTPYYSETLKNAICAIGACLTSRSDFNSPLAVAKMFTSKARVLLDIEMDSPSVATVQALVIMSASEAAFTRDARGWLYSGEFIDEILGDQGTHNEMSNTIGRPSKAQDRESHRTWTRFGDRRDPPDVDRGLDHDFSSSPPSIRLYDPIELCTDSNVSLAEMMGKLSRKLYSEKTCSGHELELLVAEVESMCRSWLADLPEELAIDLGDNKRIYVPHVLQLHMQFYAIRILAHRPLFAANVAVHGQEPEISSSQARQTCFDAAQMLVRILETYRRQHTLRRVNVQMVHLVFTASLTYVFETCTSTGTRLQTAMTSLQVCTQALTEIGQAFRNATRALELIICIKRDWHKSSHSEPPKRSALFSASHQSTEQERRNSMASLVPAILTDVGSAHVDLGTFGTSTLSVVRNTEMLSTDGDLYTDSEGVPGFTDYRAIPVPADDELVLAHDGLDILHSLEHVDYSIQGGGGSPHP
ncbi:hypothetical protein BKA63DRAFT_584879 [Paraphoma chrysanthemicola]|nr:hypothetical protein BKA63DRAFT_584879 [Paraphoma chrysanthemicola]